MINILWVIVVGLLLTGCYGDEGNYDYRTMNGITVDFNQSFYSVPIETELEISPIFRFAMDSVEDIWLTNGRFWRKLFLLIGI